MFGVRGITFATSYDARDEKIIGNHGTKSEWIPIGIIQLFSRFLLCFLRKTE